MPVIQIDALDTLFFRDSKAFTKGEDTWADTIFPPYPSVIYGALRSAWFAEDVGKLDLANKDDDPTKDLIIKNICFKQGDELYFPLPLDCVQEKGWLKIQDKKNKVFVLKPNPINKEVSLSCPTNEILQSENDKQIENVSDAIVGESALEKYLNGSSEEFSIKRRSDYISIETKVGIARSKHTHSSEENMLYRVGMNRLAKGFNDKISIIVEFEGLSISPQGLMKFGGEGKAIHYEEISTTIDIPAPELTDNKFKLYLVTPAIFKNGWLPFGIDKDTLKGSINGVGVELLTTAIGKPISIGGWDMKRGCPKTMRKAVPVGSVYYFELTDGNVKDLIKINGNSISDYNENEGFGIAYVGAVK